MQQGPGLTLAQLQQAVLGNAILNPTVPVGGLDQIPMYSSTPHFDVLLNQLDQAYYSFVIPSADRVAFDITYPAIPGNSWYTLLGASVVDHTTGNLVAVSQTPVINTVGNTSTATFAFDLPVTQATFYKLHVTMQSNDPNPVPIGITSRSVLAPAPTNCKGLSSCIGPSVDIQCDGTTNPTVVQVQQPDSSWLTVGSGTLTVGGWESLNAPFPAGTSTVTYRVCEHDGNPTLACTAPMMSTAPYCGCEPFSCSQLGTDCGLVDNGCGTKIECGTCGAGNVCSLNHCCPSGQSWSDVTQSCDVHPVVCRPPFGDCGGYCCKCGPRNPC